MKLLIIHAIVIWLSLTPTKIQLCNRFTFGVFFGVKKISPGNIVPTLMYLVLYLYCNCIVEHSNEMPSQLIKWWRVEILPCWNLLHRCAVCRLTSRRRRRGRRWLRLQTEEEGLAMLPAQAEAVVEVYLHCFTSAIEVLFEWLFVCRWQLHVKTTDRIYMKINCTRDLFVEKEELMEFCK